ncbi:MAG: hypothetical protein KBA31_13715 [Alphaproteobacteria bacterium]|nr:hypothetical protein [Alphaproteobacteria bacterium]
MTQVVTGAFGALAAAEAALAIADLGRLVSVHALTHVCIAELLAEPEARVAALIEGRAAPTLDVARKVTALAQRMAYNSFAAWKRRISASTGYEVLIDRALTIVAVNGASPSFNRGKPYSPIGPHLFLGRKYNDILPSLDCALIQTHGNGIEDLLTIGFFDGNVRCVRLCAEINAGLFVRTGVHEFWPIETEDAGIVAHSILHRNEMPRVLAGAGVHVHWREIIPA